MSYTRSTLLTDEETRDVIRLKGTKGDKGDKGVKGDKGDRGLPGRSYAHKAIVIYQDYTVTPEDFYIGVDSTGPVTITLPEDYTDCGEIVIKSEMRPPLGNRKLTLVATNGSLIDGYPSHINETSNAAIRLIYRGGHWWIT